jgi:hypothetical protein
MNPDPDFVTESAMVQLQIAVRFSRQGSRRFMAQV